MRISSEHIALLAVLLAAAALLAPFSARADGVTMQPAVIEERIEPGHSLPITLRITNLDTVTRTYYLFVRDIESVSENGAPVFTRDPHPLYGLAQWAVLSRNVITVPAQGTAEVSVLITAPKEAAPGGHFGGIFASLEAVRPTETGVGVGYEVGTIVNLRVAGEVAEEARIREFRTTATVYDAPQVTFSARIENLGNVLVRPRGPIEITSMFGDPVAVLVVNEEGAGIFPKTERTFAATWASDDRFAMGRYQATLALVYGEDERRTITESLSFWVLPTKQIALVLGGLLLILIIFVLGVRAYVRKKIRELAPGATPVLPSSQLLFITVGAVVFVLILLFAVFFFFG